MKKLLIVSILALFFAASAVHNTPDKTLVSISISIKEAA